MAIAAGAVLLLALLGVIASKNQQVPVIQAFVPIVDSTLFLNDLVTAALLYAQYAVIPRRGVLILAMGYLFTALIVVPHLLMFPGAFAAAGLLGANLQSPIWTFTFKYLGFPLAAIGYALQKDVRSGERRPSTARVLGLSVAAVLALVCALTWLVTRDGMMPQLMLDGTRAAWSWNSVVAPALVVAHLAALAVLWRRRSSVLDLWLLLALWAWFIEVLLLSMTTTRFSAYYYGAVFGVVGSCFVLVVLLFESTILYARFLVLASERDRERDRQRLTMQVLAGSIAHELKQPLAAIVANSEAGRRFLTRTPPEQQEVFAALDGIRASGRRASDTLTSIGTALAGAPQPRTPVNISELVRETLGLLRGELHAHDVVVQFDVPAVVPLVRGNSGQLRQVLVNLVTNALEAMREVTDRPRRLTLRCGRSASGAVSLSVEDCGPGVPSEHLARVFDPFFTTKTHGTGIGLALCRLIVESHGGTIAASRAIPHGSVFEVVLPAPGASVA